MNNILLNFLDNGKGDMVSLDLSLIDRLMDSLIVKMKYKAEHYETEETLLEYQKYKDAYFKISTLKDYVITVEDILYVVNNINETTASNILKGELSNYLSTNQLNLLLNLKRAEVMDSYEEKNDYYRMLLGLPPIESLETDYILINGKPIHTLNQYEISTLKDNGDLYQIRNKYVTPDNTNYWYLKYIDKFMDIITMREAEQFAIIYFSNDELEVKYRDSYNKERVVWMCTYHSDFLCKNDGFGNESYQEALEVTQLKVYSLITFLMNYGANSLEKTRFTEREAIQIWKEHGLTFPKTMPESYRNPVTFLINYLVAFKGTNKILDFLCNNVFNGVTLYKFFIVKKLSSEIDDPNIPTDVYDVSYVRTPFYANTPYDVSERDKVVYSYDDISALDPKWDDNLALREQIYSEDFSYVNSKYLSISNYIKLNELTIELTTLSRGIIQSDVVNRNKSLFYTSTASYHSFFGLWLYYISLTYSLISKANLTSADTLSFDRWYKGITIPENFDSMKINWWNTFINTEYRDFLNEFPDALNDNDTFGDFVYKVDKQLEASIMFELILASCNTIHEWDVAMDYYNQIRYTRNSPDSFGITPDETGKSLVELLQDEDYGLYEQLLKTLNSDETEITLEFENITNTLIDNISYNVEVYDPTYIKEALETNMQYVNGVSSYLLYILNLFKAYSTEILSGNTVLAYDSDMVKIIDNNYRVGTQKIRDDLEISQYISINYDLNSDNPISKYTTSDAYFIKTPYGTIKVSYDDNEGGL